MTTPEKIEIEKQIKKLLGPCRVIYYPDYNKPNNSRWVIEETTDFHTIAEGGDEDTVLMEALEYAKKYGEGG